jgi:hypothetical protein
MKNKTSFVENENCVNPGLKPSEKVYASHGGGIPQEGRKSFDRGLRGSNSDRFLIVSRP